MKLYILTYLKGIGMGLADLVPGVSGGTIAFISGIYERFINSIKSFNLSLFKTFKEHGIKGVFQAVDGKFLLSLVLGIGTAIVTFSRLIKFLLDHEVYATYLWSFFFGLIISSILLIAKDIDWKKIGSIIGTLLGIAIGVYVSLATPTTGSTSLPYIFLCGFIAISAMVLPGISGSFILLLMGAYATVITAINNVIHGMNTEALLTVVVFALGAGTGLLTIVRVISWAFKHFKNIIVATLLGIMTGSLIKVWPWKNVTDSVTIEGKEKVLATANYFPEFGSELMLGVTFMLIGFFLIFLLEKWGSRMKTTN